MLCVVSNPIVGALISAAPISLLGYRRNGTLASLSQQPSHWHREGQGGRRRLGTSFLASFKDQTRGKKGKQHRCLAAMAQHFFNCHLSPLLTFTLPAPACFDNCFSISATFLWAGNNEEHNTDPNMPAHRCSLCVKYVQRQGTSFSIAENIETQRMSRLHNEIPGHVKCQNYKILNIYSGHVLLS